jgi:hypothetical protein
MVAMKKIGTWIATGGLVLAIGSEYLLPDKWKGTAWTVAAVATILYGLVLVGLAGSLEKRLISTVFSDTRLKLYHYRRSYR